MTEYFAKTKLMPTTSILNYDDDIPLRCLQLTCFLAFPTNESQNQIKETEISVSLDGQAHTFLILDFDVLL